jgi:hypothetical protein
MFRSAQHDSGACLIVVDLSRPPSFEDEDDDENDISSSL